jgi:transposase
MPPIASSYVGADVAQDSIAFCGPTATTVANAPAALRTYLRALPAHAHLVCEATGRHHHLLHRECAAAGRPLTVLNPAWLRDFARSLGKLEKTDALDGAVLRRFGQERQPAPTPRPAPERQALLDLLMVRQALVSDRSDHRRRDHLLAPAARAELRALGRVLQTRQRALEHRLAAWLEAADPLWRERVQTLCLVPGVSILSALQLLAYLPELGSCNRRQIAKLAGLAPLPWDSGTQRGVRCIQHGRAPARRVLYQCAVVAARWNEALRPLYLRLRARGKPAKLAYVAVARRLLGFLNSLLRP